MYEQKEQPQHNSNIVATEGKKRRIRKVAILAGALSIMLIVGIGSYVAYQVRQESKYQEAITAQENGDYEKAIAMLQELGKYKDSFEQYSHAVMRETKYKEAIDAQEAGEYENAISIFQILEDYRDSYEQLQRAEFMHNYTHSSSYTDIMSTIQRTLSDKCINYDVAFQFSEMELMISGYVDSDFKNADIMTIEQLKEWEQLVDTANVLTTQIPTIASKGGFEISADISILHDSGNDLLYQAVNGVEIYSKIDFETEKKNTVGAIYAQMLLYKMDEEYESVCEYWDTAAEGYLILSDYDAVDTCYREAKEKLVEPLYQEIKSLADSGKYREACEYWEQNNKNGYYQLSDKEELSNYYYYSHALQAYIAKNSFTPGELVSIDDDLEKVTPEFKDTLIYRKEVLDTVNSVVGSFKHTGLTIGDGSGSRWWHSSFQIIIAKTEAFVVIETGISTSYVSSPSPSSIDRMSTKYTPICVINDGKLQYVNLIEEGTENVAYKLGIEGNALTATSSSGSCLDYYRV